MKAYVLAAGYATRLGSLARDRAKPLLDVGGRPVLSYTMDRLADLDDLSEVVVITNSRFHGQFVEWASSCGGRLPIRVLDDGSTRVEDRRGAIGDLAFGLDTVPPRADEDWVVVAGDNLVGFDLGPLHGIFRKARAPLLVLRRLETPDARTGYNEVTLDSDGWVVRFREKPRDAGAGASAIALYFFTARVTALLSRYRQTGHEQDAPGHFVSWLVGEVPVRGAFFEGDWFDVGRPETLEAARRALAERSSES